MPAPKCIEAPTGRHARTDAATEYRSAALAQRAARALERLYRMIDCDEPDLAANVAFVVERDHLRRLAGAEPWRVDPEVAGTVLTLVESAERVGDPRAATARLTTFARSVRISLDRRRRREQPAPRPGRRTGDPPASASSGVNEQHPDRSGDRRAPRAAGETFRVDSRATLALVGRGTSRA